MFWQYGDTLSNGQTTNDGNTVYYGSSEWTSLVTDHVTAINSGSSPPPTTTMTTSTAGGMMSTSAAGGGTSTSMSFGGRMAPHWGRYGGIGRIGPTLCASP
jgi:mannan endo-1,4-beta-mannosidase